VIADNDYGGSVDFNSGSSAGQAMFINQGGTVSGAYGGITSFTSSGTAGNCTVISNGASVSGAFGGVTAFVENATAGNGTFITNGGTASGAGRGYVYFDVGGTTGDGVFITNGVTALGAGGGAVRFFGDSSADNATFVANGGTDEGDGAAIYFFHDSIGASARFELLDDGRLDISGHNAPGVDVGSVEGSGFVYLGANELKVGTNNRSTAFVGVIQDGGLLGGSGGWLTKIGTGTFTLSGANTYTGGTTVSEGVLLAHSKQGSATGTGDVTVNGGVLGGNGIVGGRVSIDAGGFLSPGRDGPGTLRIKRALRFNSNGTYLCELQTAMGKADAVVARNVKIKPGASASIDDIDTIALPPGTVFTIINNTGARPISGTFSNLADGSIFVLGANVYQANYEGGDGNDLTLTVVP
jgi:autotransporter-associated beta strand protein